ncbi:MAG: diguanylate cyclase [Pseudomonadota bacterium]
MKFKNIDVGSTWPTIFDAVGFGLVLVDADAHVLLWNGWLTRHSGVSAQAAVGQPLTEALSGGLSPSFVTALNNVLQYRLPVVLSNVLHRCPLPLYAQLPASPSADRLPHAITMTPLAVEPWGPCCLIQIADSSRAISREKVLQKNSDRLSRELMTDSLTRALSRGFFDQFYQQEFARARRQNTRLSLILLDVDYFKNYNDEYGHPAGDKVLITVVQALGAVLLRSTDRLARYGGEEFIVILPDCAASKAQAIAEQLRAAVLALKLPHLKSKMSDQITVSLGVSTLEADQSCSPEELLAATDLALYAAKRNGRNCVQFRHPQGALQTA